MFMKNLSLQGTETSPTVEFDVAKGHCLISGESFLEHAVEFYEPLIKWIQGYTANNPKSLQLDVKLTYFNTKSSKRINDILKVIKQYQDKGGTVTVNWFYEKGDVDLEEEIDDYRISTGLEINLVAC